MRLHHFCLSNSSSKVFTVAQYSAAVSRILVDEAVNHPPSQQATTEPLTVLPPILLFLPFPVSKALEPSSPPVRDALGAELVGGVRPG